MNASRQIALAGAVGLVVGLGAGVGATLVWQGAPSTDAPVVSAPADPAAAPTRTAAWPDGFAGVVLAGERAALAPNVDGRLAEVHANLGDTVRADDVVAVVTVAVTEHRVEEARASLEIARAEERTAEIDLRAAQQQLEQLPGLTEAISQQEASDIRFAAERARASLDRARADVAAHAHELAGLRATASESVIRAPFDGRISARYLDPGALVGPATPVLELQGTTFRVRFATPLSALPEIFPGQTVLTRIADSGRTLSATVDRVSPAMDPSSGLVFAEAQVDIEGGALLSGQPARVWPK